MGKATANPGFFRRSELAAILGRFRRDFAYCAIYSMAINVLMLTPTIYMLQIYDRVLVSQSSLTLAAVTLVMLFLLAVMAGAEWSRSRLLVRAGVRLDAELNSRVFGASFEAYLNRLGHNPVQAFSDLTNIRQFLTGHGLFAFMDAPWTLIFILVLGMLHPWLGGLALLFVLLLIGLAYASHRLTSALADAANDAAVEANTYVQGKLRNGEVVESMGMLGNLLRRWQHCHRRYLGLSTEASARSARIQSFTKFVRYSQQSLMLAAGALLVIDGQLSPGAMIGANVLMARALQPVEAMLSAWKCFVTVRAAFRRLESLLAEHPEREAGRVHAVPRGHVEVDNLVASAPGRASPILKGIGMDIRAGEVIAIVGPSGSGKSTLARALVGIWPDIQGSVRLDGEALATWNREELGPHLGYLPQDIELFDGSIAENIGRFGAIEPAEVIRAAQRTGVHDMILRFPRGYDTPIGEAGKMLSGGQRQRIGLARAIYGDPKLIVLDEPNANLDDLGEAALIEAVKDLQQQGRTVVLVTHRGSILEAADRILMLRDGEIEFFGTRQEMAARMQPTGRLAGGDGRAAAVAPAV